MTIEAELFDVSRWCGMINGVDPRQPEQLDRFDCELTSPLWNLSMVVSEVASLPTFGKTNST
jgi:hypothetical protein